MQRQFPQNTSKPLALALAITLPGFASQAIGAQVLEEVVVTAQKRSESLQQVPVSIMAFGGQGLENAGVTSADQLGQVVPNLQLNRGAQASAMAIRIRGVGSPGNNAIDPSVAPFVDGVYIARGGAMLNSFLDVDSVEVLRGPQGTLFGRNATTGALQVNTRAPSFDGFNAELFGEVGNYNAHRLRAIVNVPLGDTFALRFAGISDQRDGMYDNRLDGKDYGDRDATVSRLSARWQPTEQLDWIVRVDYAEMGGDGLLPAEVSSDSGPADAVARFGSMFGPLSPDISDPLDGTVSQRLNGELDDEQWGVSSDLNYYFNNDYQLRWIASQRRWENEQLDGDVIFTGLDLLDRVGSYDSDSMSQEIQLISPEGALFNERMDFVLGLYYFEEDYEVGEVFNLGSAYCSTLLGPVLAPVCLAAPQVGATDLSFEQTAESVAAFLETHWRLSDALKLTLGGRYTEDDKSGTFKQVLFNPFTAATRAPESGSYDFADDQFTYRVVLSWTPSDDIMLFGGFSTGYKSGGINSSGVASSLDGKRLFDSESVENIELGIRSTLLDGLMQLNATAFRMEIDDFQDRAFRDASFLITNAGSLRQQGVELESKWLATDALSFDFSAAYLDSEFTDFKNATPLPGCAVLPVPGTPECPNPQDNTGKRGTFSPQWQISAAAEHVASLPGDFTLTSRVNVSWADEQLAGGSDLNPQTMIDGYALWNARMTLEDSSASWAFSLWGKNLTDERYPIQHFTQVLGGALGLVNTETGETVLRHYLSEPRTYGISLSYYF